MLISPLFIAEIDEAMNHYSVRSEYTAQAGFALANTLDKNVAQVGVLAARAAATVSGGNGGTVITEADADSDADALVAALYAASQAMDEKDVPESERYAFLRPAEYNLLVASSSKAIHKDFGGRGSIASGVVLEVAGLEIVKTNNLPSKDVDTGPAHYQGDFTGTAGLVMHRSAVGTVKLVDLSVQMEYQLEYLGWLIVAKMAVGSGILRPESAVEISTV